MSAAAISGIDHVLAVVSDLDHAAATYRRLGFTLSPRAVHSAHMGTANHTIMLERDYFELLGIVTPTEANATWRRVLAKGEGLAGLAAAAPSAAAAGVTWREAGFATGDIRGFSRPVERPGGIWTEARFEVVTLPVDAMPAMSVFACAQLTPDAVWLPELLNHRNTARAIRKLCIAAPDPTIAAESWSRALPGSLRVPTDGGAQIRFGFHAIDFVDPALAAHRYGFTRSIVSADAVGIEFEVTDPDACRNALVGGGLSPRRRGDMTFVASEDACGVAIAFLPAGAPLG